MKDCHARSRSDRYMGKFHCDIAAAHKKNVAGEPF
jgi:hypothetical protein